MSQESLRGTPGAVGELYGVWVLGAGYTVSAALTDKDAVAFVEYPNTIGLVLMCHSVPEASRISLVARIKQLKPKLPVLMLYNGYDPTDAKVDGSLHSLETPEAMLDMIGFMTRNIGDQLPV